MEAPRPDPDALLSRLKAEAGRAGRGRLKIFLGACAGVGKTYAMLEAARAKRKEGADVVAGLVETHRRQETEALLEGLERLPRRDVLHRGVRLAEFDLDAALRRRPKLMLIDELAHNNASGSRHLKRWQDVKELLDNGIDVYTTLNIQHLESLNDVVARVTGMTVQETVPDSFFEQADAIEAVDLPYEELLKRFNEGKVYIPEQAERARQNFFRPEKIAALRELALRFTAERVNEQVQALRQAAPGAPAWPTAEKILVLVGPSPTSIRLIRHATRLANSLHCDWIALYVETPGRRRTPAEDQDRAAANLRAAVRLGAEVVTLTGSDLVETAVDFARERNVTRILVGRPARRGLLTVIAEFFTGRVTEKLARRSGEIDVIVTQGDPETSDVKPAPSQQRTARAPWRRYGACVAVVALCTLICWPISGLIETANLVMIYLLGVVLLATRFGRGPAVLASVLSVVAFDFFFVPPKRSFAVADTQYLFTFLVMLVVALVISALTVRLRDAIDKSRLRERRTASLNALSRKLAMLRGQEAILRAAVEHIAEIFDSDVIALLPDAAEKLHVRASQPPGLSLDQKEMAVAQWVHDLGQIAGKGTDTIPSAERLYVPLLASHGSFGALGLKALRPESFLIPEQLQLLEAMAQQAALALEVERLTEEARGTQVQIESERLRSVLLSSVSHDLRTPLAAITGAASSLLDESSPLPEAGRREMMATISQEAERLNQQITNLLEMSRLESGPVRLRKEFQPLEETIGSACQRLERQLMERPLRVVTPPDLPLVPADSVLLETVFFNLLENAVKYTPPATPIEIESLRRGDEVVVEVRDRGPGIGAGEEERIFEKFIRGAAHGSVQGAGLGLAICRAIVHAHGGQIRAANRPGGGAVFSFSLPLETAPGPIGQPEAAPEGAEAG